MSDSFTFKQFTVFHDRCAMKVGTDGVLLGAWAPVGNARRILDVGTGTGLIALQLAQRTASVIPHTSYLIPAIVALEIDSSAAEQAAENVARSPWSGRVEVICQDFRDYRSDEPFDLIVSNPPYFVDGAKCPDDGRRLARHTDSLSYDLLFQCSARLLSPNGTVCVIVPADAEQSVLDAAWRSHLHPMRRLQLFTKPGKPCRRLLFAFTSDNLPTEQQTLCIESPQGGYTPAYIALTRDFYLNM